MTKLLLFIPLLIVGCLNQNIKVITEDNEDVSISVGQTFMVKLKSTISTGYTWQLKEPIDDKLLVLTKKEYVDKQGEFEINSGYDLLTFRALKKGEALIKLWYVRPWELKKNEIPEKEKQLKVIINP